MGIIYYCWNKNTKQLYIGATSYTLEERIQDHKNKAKNDSKRKLHKALKSNPESDFVWGVHEDNIPTEQLAEREIFWIDHYKSLKYGYNGTSGGDGLSKFTDDDRGKMMVMWKNNWLCVDIASYFGCGIPAISNILKAKGITSEEIEERRRKLYANAVAQIEPKTGRIIKTYDSIGEASRATGIDNSNIGKCCKGVLNSAGKFIWRLMVDISDEELLNEHVDYVPANYRGSVMDKLSFKEVYSDYVFGMTLREIGDKYGCDKETIKKFLIENGICEEEIRNRKNELQGHPLILTSTITGAEIYCISLAEARAFFSSCDRSIKKSMVTGEPLKGYKIRAA